MANFLTKPFTGLNDKWAKINPANEVWQKMAALDTVWQKAAAVDSLYKRVKIPDVVQAAVTRVTKTLAHDAVIQQFANPRSDYQSKYAAVEKMVAVAMKPNALGKLAAMGDRRLWNEPAIFKGHKTLDAILRGYSAAVARLQVLEREDVVKDSELEYSKSGEITLQPIITTTGALKLLKKATRKWERTNNKHSKGISIYQNHLLGLIGLLTYILTVLHMNQSESLTPADLKNYMTLVKVEGEQQSRERQEKLLEWLNVQYSKWQCRRVVSKDCKVYLKPQTACLCIGALPAGTQLVTLETNGKWVKVSFEDTDGLMKDGWVLKKYTLTIRPSKASQSSSLNSIEPYCKSSTAFWRHLLPAPSSINQIGAVRSYHPRLADVIRVDRGSGTG